MSPLQLPNRQWFVHFFKYSLTGFGNLLFTLAVYTLCLSILRFHYLAAYSISWLLGVLFTYIINFTWVFKPEEKLRFRERLVKYIIVYIFSFALNFWLLRLLTESTGADPLLSQLFIIPLIVIVNFAGIKYWVMGKSHPEPNVPGAKE